LPKPKSLGTSVLKVALFQTPKPQDGSERFLFSTA